MFRLKLWIVSCKAFAERGCIVYATARSVKSMQGFQDEAIKQLALDVTNEEQVKSVVKTIVAKEGHIDVVINNAGVLTPGALLCISFAFYLFLCHVLIPIYRTSDRLYGRPAQGRVRRQRVWHPPCLPSCSAVYGSTQRGCYSQRRLGCW
jgi:short chain dehydrogenase